jgi:Uma2 family endonuclease
MSQQSTADLSARVMTLAEWADMDEDQPGELIDGQIVEEEEVGAEHDIVGAWLIWTLRTWLASRGGFVGMSDTRFVTARSAPS